MLPHNYFVYLDLGDTIRHISPGEAQAYHFADTQFGSTPLYIAHHIEIMDLGRDLHFNPAPIIAPSCPTILLFAAALVAFRRARN